MLPTMTFILFSLSVILNYPAISSHQILKRAPIKAASYWNMLLPETLKQVIGVLLTCEDMWLMWKEIILGSKSC